MVWKWYAYLSINISLSENIPWTILNCVTQLFVISGETEVSLSFEHLFYFPLVLFAFKILQI